MAKEIGSTGLIEYGGIIQEDFLREWRLPESCKRVTEMLYNSPTVAALMSVISLAIRKVNWSLTSETGDTDPRLEVWEASVRNMRGGFGDFLDGAISFLAYGFSLHEIVWAPYESMTIVGKLAERSQDTVQRWLLGDNGEFNGFVQVCAPRYIPVELPAEKLIHLTINSAKGNPEGRSILRPAWIPYYYSKNIQQIEAIGIERDLAGLPVIKLPQTANTNENDSESDASKAAKMVRNIRQDQQAGIVLPAGWELSLLSTGGSRQFDTDKVITRYEGRILMAGLAQFLMLGQQTTGSWALSSDQTDIFNMSVNAVADIIGAAISEQLLPRLMALNGYNTEGLKFDHTPAGDDDISGLGDFLGKVAGLLTWTTQDEVWLRDLAGLPAVAEEEIDAERERKQAAADAIAQATAPRGNAPQQPAQDEPVDEEDLTDEDTDQMGVEFFRSIPDSLNRQRYERKMQGSLRTFFTDELARVIKQVRGARR